MYISTQKTMSRMVREMDRANSSAPSLADPASPIELVILGALMRLADNIAKRELPRVAEKAIQQALTECQEECVHVAREMIQDFLQNPMASFTFPANYNFLLACHRNTIRESVEKEVKAVVQEAVKAAIEASDLEGLVRTVAQVTLANDVQKAARSEVKRLIDRVTNDMLNSIPERPSSDVGPRRVIT